MMFSCQWKSFVHIFVLSSFAFAQPVFDIVGKHTEFLVVHGAGPLAILGLAAILSVCIPTVLCLILLVAQIINRFVWATLHALLTSLLVLLVFLPPAGNVLPEHAFLSVTAALFVSLAFTVLYFKIENFRMIMTMLAPVVLIFPLWFIFMTPVKGLVVQDSVSFSDYGVHIKDTIPIVIVVLDELNTVALLDKSERIDSERFPYFAELAAHSFWFPNAVGPHYQTMYALPSILTGRMTFQDSELNPIASDHPDNLFSLLAGQYEINSFEAQTRLCPASICEDQGWENHFTSLFFADISIIFLHLITPQSLRHKLPSMDAQWAGFGHRERYEQSCSYYGRHHQFDDFISRIQDDASNQLHFLHTLLPHVPYEFLSTGHSYNRSINHTLPEGIRDEMTGWPDKEDLILVAYHQYLQQTGYVDLLLGRLLERLKEVGIYDDSLIILTADHGVSFRPGQHRRIPSEETFSEIFKVPMFVKLPSQKDSYVVKDIVSGIDILPTIADVLGIDLPWDVDGISMVSNQSLRDGILLPELGLTGYDDISGFPNFKWQLKHFGYGTPLEILTPQGVYSSLIGLNPANIAAYDTYEDICFNSELMTYFEHIDISKGFLPALFSGEIEGRDVIDLPIAIALNNKIWSVTRTSQWLRTDRYFAALFPPGAFKEGNNPVGVFMVIDESDPVNLARIRPCSHRDVSGSIHSKADGYEYITFNDGPKIPIDIRSGTVMGFIDGLTIQDGIVHIKGWAGDCSYHPVDSVNIFWNNKLVFQVRPQQARQDVADHFQEESLLFSGFQASIPLHFHDFDINEVRAIAIDLQGNAGELVFPDHMK